MSKKGNIEDIFKNSFDGNEVTPPQNLWGKLQESLNESYIEDVYRENFKDEKKKPPVAIWFAIQQKLWWSQFLSFQANTINVYYVAAALLVSLGLWSVNNNEDATNQIEQKIVQNEKKELQKVKLNEVDKVKEQELVKLESTAPNQLNERKQNVYVKQNVSEHSMKHATSNELKVEPEIKAIDAKSPVVLKEKDAFMLKNSVQKKSENIFPFDFSKVKISGQEKICNKTVEIYTASGLDSEVLSSWEVQGNAAEIVQQTNTEIHVIWQKPGNTEIQLSVSSPEKTMVFKYPVQVYKSINNQIKGEQVVCQGDEEVGYNVTNSNDVNKEYIWDSKIKNPYKVRGNGAIYVDWQIAGWDTLYVVDNNTETGCNFRMAYPIHILPRPSANFEIIDNGNGKIIFKDASVCRIGASCSFTNTWVIDGVNYDGNEVNVEFDYTNTVYVEMNVQDENGCRDYVSKESKIYLHKIKPPTGVRPDKPFIPSVSDELSSYRLQIFDANWDKLWESTVLEDGRPAIGWDGTSRGALQPEGTYFWKIDATFTDGAVWKGEEINGKNVKQGTVQLEY